MADEPSYLGMLNAIAIGEGRGCRLLNAWAERTDDATLAAVLRLVALRSREHAAAFSRRLYELGFDPKEPGSGEYEAQLALARSNASDLEKFRRILGFENGQPADNNNENGSVRRDPLLELFVDPTIDIETGALLGRYVATERDSERRLREAYANLKPHPEPDNDAARTSLDDIYAQLDKLTRTIDELKSLAKLS